MSKDLKMRVSWVFQMGPGPSQGLTAEGGRRDRGRGHEPRNMWPLEARKGTEVESSLELLEGTRPANTWV